MRASQVCAVTIGSLALFSISVELCNGAAPKSQSDTNSHILLYIPFAAKSSCITLVVMANELVKRGHEVTLVTSWESLKPDKNVNHIVLTSRIKEHMDKRSKAAFGTGASLGPMDMIKVADNAVATNSDALKKLKLLIDDSKSNPDMVVTSLHMMGNEASYYLAHRSNATLVLFTSVQQSLPTMNWAIGQPHNPAIIPLFITKFA